MLSYQHAYHAGNMADVHKHALLAASLEYLTRKPKPLTYLETHSGRALYDLDGPEALKTGEAARGIGKAESWFDADHPYMRALTAARAVGGTTAYPGSPFIARTLLRADDRMILAERHPQEVAALRGALPGADVRATDGPSMALSLCPPTPRRGIALIDPSYEVKDDYTAIPGLLRKLHRKWPVGVLMLWYPILTNGAERAMVGALEAIRAEKTLHHRVGFPPARKGHGMIGSGMFILNPPWGLDDEAARLAARFSPAA